ncbi:hypothetical protein XI05_06790 [Bradyrhizobium sp. CCBAU 11357]|nr:hypothetical protein [Bradyrhizobium sp. CCBAU 11357]
MKEVSLGERRNSSKPQIFAALGTSVIALPAFAPKAKASETVALAKADRLLVRSVAQSCLQQVWPDFATACLRSNGSEAKIVEARLVTARR